MYSFHGDRIKFDPSGAGALEAAENAFDNFLSILVVGSSELVNAFI
jgi:hypothetical protein